MFYLSVMSIVRLSCLISYLNQLRMMMLMMLMLVCVQPAVSRMSSAVLTVAVSRLTGDATATMIAGTTVTNRTAVSIGFVLIFKRCEIRKGAAFTSMILVDKCGPILRYVYIFQVARL